MKDNRGHAFAINYLRITALVTAFIGLGLLLWPDRTIQWFIAGGENSFFVRFIGSALLGYSTLNWLASKSRDFKTYRIAVDANLVTLNIATILSIIGVASGAIGQLGWLLILEHALFTLLFVWARYTIKKD